MPSILIAGVFKAGTSSLYTYLSRHPDICIGIKKELHFLLNSKCEQALYDNQYMPTYNGQKHILEASPAYFETGKTCAKRIFDFLGRINVIVILREPVSLIVSNFIYMRQNQRLAHKSIWEMLEAIKSRRHHGWDKHFIEWEELFGNHFHITFLENFIKDKMRATNALSAFLNIDAEPLNCRSFLNDNPSYNPRSPTIHKRLYSLVNMLKARNIYISRIFRSLALSTYRLINASNTNLLQQEKKQLKNEIDESVQDYMHDELNHLLILLNEKSAIIPDWLRKYAH